MIQTSNDMNWENNWMINDHLKWFKDDMKCKILKRWNASFLTLTPISISAICWAKNIGLIECWLLVLLLLISLFVLTKYCFNCQHILIFGIWSENWDGAKKVLKRKTFLRNIPYVKSFQKRSTTMAPQLCYNGALSLAD